MIIRTSFLTAAALLAVLGTAHAENPFAKLEQASPQASAPADDARLLIVNGKTHHVIYDDGKNDLFCVTRRVVVGYDGDGDPIYRRRMKCR